MILPPGSHYSDMRKHEGRKDMKKRFLMAIALLSAILLTSACSGSVSPFQNLQSSESFSGFDSSVAESSQDDSSGSSSAESSANILSISACSFERSIRISLLASTTLIGSMNTVAPLAEVSWTRCTLSSSRLR